MVVGKQSHTAAPGGRQRAPTAPILLNTTQYKALEYTSIHKYKCKYKYKFKLRRLSLKTVWKLQCMYYLQAGTMQGSVESLESQNILPQAISHNTALSTAKRSMSAICAEIMNSSEKFNNVKCCCPVILVAHICTYLCHRSLSCNELQQTATEHCAMQFNAMH